MRRHLFNKVKTSKATGFSFVGFLCYTGVHIFYILTFNDINNSLQKISKKIK
jgi:hypothetical protein